LLGGKVRQAADVYRHASGDSLESLLESAQGYIAQGVRHIRIQMAIEGNANYGARNEGAGRGFLGAPSGGPHNERMYEPTPYLLSVPKMFEYLRKNLGDEIELLHDTHERISNDQAMWLCKRLEEYRPFFLEDPVSPEQIGYFRHIRSQCTTSIAMGELFNSPRTHFADRRPHSRA
jgi:mannonate dehydratase